MCISTPICEVVEPKWELLSGWARGNLISSSPWSHLAHLCYCCWCCDPQWSQKDRFSSPESQEEFYHNYLFTWLIRTRWTQRALRVRLSREARRPVGNWEAGRVGVGTLKARWLVPFVLCLVLPFSALLPLIGSLFLLSSCRLNFLSARLHSGVLLCLLLIMAQKSLLMTVSMEMCRRCQRLWKRLKILFIVCVSCSLCSFSVCFCSPLHYLPTSSYKASH